MSGFPAKAGFTYSPRAFLSRLSSSSWIVGLTLPSRRMSFVLSMVKSFFSLKTETFFSPVLEKSGWSGVSIKSVSANFLEGTMDEIKAMTTSSSCGSGDTMTAGRSFSAVRSVKGKGTSTMSPRLRRVWGISIEPFSILDSINVFAGTTEETVTASFVSNFSNKGGG